MKINRIEIKNYKGFQSEKVEFHPKVNVFIGSNGAGKTSILNAVLKSMFSITRQYAHPLGDVANLDISAREINYNGKYSLLRSWFSFPEYQTEIPSTSMIGNLPETSIHEVNTLQIQTQAFIQWLWKKIQQGPLTIPIFKFYPADRGSIKYTEYRQNNSFTISQLEAWSNLYQNTYSYSRFFEWFLENETNELRLQRDARDFTIQSPVLKDVRIALERAFTSIGYPKSRIKSKEQKQQGHSKLIPTLVLENLQTGYEESLDNKSDGEKAIISLVADIAYNLSLAKDFVYDDDFLKSPGVVIIDEIETHLHPNWQRRILPILTDVFPHIQFFVATHSPQIISSITSDSVFVCENFKIHQLNLKTFGQDSNSLLKYIFNSTDRPARYVSLLERFDEIIETEKSYQEADSIIRQINELESFDDSSGISNLVSDLRMRLEAYKYEQEHEKDN